MQSDKRKTQRKPLRYSAWITGEGVERIGCVLTDISDSGARIEVENAETVPDHFTLMFTANGGPRRLCKVAWREKGIVGVHFDRRQQVGARTRPEVAPPTVPADSETAADTPAAAVEEKA